ncbi:SGNH/GDSL hydrolase family protein [Clostridium sp. MT-14]|uniref:SGNH/GDSL hydrolase family protein n=1 Tax=Clostridium sp. MT-14 TaxID=3348360 RepID=UPI0035F3A015
MIKKIIVKISIFITILIFMIYSITPIFILKTDHRSKLIEGLYNHTGNAYDVVLMGGSHMNGGIDPNVLWHDYGITSFNYATGGQSMDMTYYMLKEVLKKHENPVVVLDAYYLAQSAEYGQRGYISNVLDNMKFSMNKLEAIWNCTPLEDRLEYLIPFLKYHYRWNQLTENDFNYDSSEVYYAKGFAAGTKKYGKDDSTANQTSRTVSGTVNLPTKSLAYLNKIIDLCKENNLKLILVNTPFDYNSDAASNEWVSQQAKMFNKVAEIAKKENIPFINYNDKMDEIDLDFKNDMNNSGHLNIWGAYKVTKDFGDYLKQNYNLKDHRNDNAYSQWNADYKRSQAATYITDK